VHGFEEDLRAAQAAGVIGAEDLTRLLAFLAGRQRQAGAGSGAAPRQQFDAAHLLWYAGALIVIGAMGLFSTMAFSQLGGGALAATAIGYAIAFTFAGNYLWQRSLTVPGGLLIAIAVAMAPLAVFGIQKELGWWGQYGEPGAYNGYYVWIKGSWIFMDAATILAGIVALRFYRFPFIVSVIACALWFMSMDLTPWVFRNPHPYWSEYRLVSIWFGLAVIAAAWVVDFARQPRFAFWLHFAGLLAFWGGISASEGGSEAAKALYCLLNAGLLAAALVLSRQVYAVFGALGISLYLGHLASSVFKDSLLFPFALSLIGIGVLASGLLYRRKQDAIEAWMAANLPEPLLRLRPDHS
jgi:hypothetical protein